MTHEIDVHELAAMVRQKRGNQGLRAAADDIGGVSASTLSRIEQGNLPDLDTYMKLCRWLGVSPERFMPEKSNAAETTLDTAELLSAHLRADRLLAPETAEALSQMIRLAYQAAAAGVLPRATKEA